VRLARAALPALLVAGLVAGTHAAAATATVLAAVYAVPIPPPATIAASAVTQVSVQLTNTGTEAWNATGPNPVNLSFHWYDASGAAVVWDGARTALGADVPVGGQRTVATNVIAPADAGTYALRFSLVKEGVAWFTPSVAFPVSVAGATYSAAYQAVTPPTAIPAGTSAQIAVTLTNNGNQAWTVAGPNPVNLAYHWYDGAGNAVVWDGQRTRLAADVPPGGSATVTALVSAPNIAGPYQLRFALVREGVAWFAPSAALPINALAAFVAAFTQPTLPAFVAGGQYTVNVAVRNAGAAAWPFAGVNPITLSYHWTDVAGTVVVWDGSRTRLAADLAPNASVTVPATIVAPNTAGSYTLTLDMVREGVAWFGQLGNATYSVGAPVVAVRYAASYGFASALSAYWGEQKSVPVTVTNTGNVPWNATGANPIDLSYHLLDASGNVVLWDGARALLGGDLAPGASRAIPLTVTAPTANGTYTLAVEMVREGSGWFSQLGAPAATIALPVTSGLNGGYGASTTPGQVTIGAVIDLSVTISNFGPRTWPAAGANPVELSYHIVGANTGTVYVWDGNRGKLPSDVPAQTSVTVPIRVGMPAGVGDYVMQWDLVQEGVAWFSQVNVASKREPFTVISGVVFYGSGFGHGVGMSQYGANGYATGAAGPALTGEQIIAKYFPGSAFQFGDVARPFNRVLLSQPSSQSRYRCNTNSFFDGYFGDVVSNAGFRVLDESSNNLEIGRAGANQKWQFVARGGVIEVWNNGGAQPLRVGGAFSSVAVVPLDPAQPLRFVQKDQTDGRLGFYRGNLRFTNLGNTLRVVNAVSYDDYTRGVISFEMPSAWHAEALKAQAYAARSYAYASFRGGARDYDVSDDQSDQCYGGVTAEGPRTDAAVIATAGKLVTYQGVIVKTYFSSSSGGYTLEFGCWGTRVRPSAGTYICTPDPTQPSLAAVPDPGDRAVSNPPNPRASWTATFTGSQIASAVLCAGGPNIGSLQGIDVSNQSPALVGHVISVRVIGSAATADVRAEDLLRTCLGLRSTMVRLAPF
jgi:peptidoglycan hydrolase-like amidase